MPNDADVERARDLFAARKWRAAYDAFGVIANLDADDLERLGTTAYLLGDNDGYFAHLEQAHRQHQDALKAANCAVWIGVVRSLIGDLGQAEGWFARAARLVEQDGRDTAVLGHLLVPRMFQHEAQGDFAAAVQCAAECEAIGRRVGDPDLIALAGQERGQLLIRLGNITEGMRCLDEAMVAATSGDLSPIANGIVYCGVIVGCRMAYDLRRAQEWTSVMLRWCMEQPDLVPYAGLCRVHHAELLDLSGAWREALAEARSVTEPDAIAEAAYVQGGLHRQLGRFSDAETSYAEASRLGREPQPGLALLRLAQDSPQAAVAMISRCLGETRDPGGRASLLPAAVEILMGAGDEDGAAEAALELTTLASTFESSLLAAFAQHADGAVALAGGRVEDALGSLRSAVGRWHALGAPYAAARSRVLIAQACRTLGDEESADLEVAAARETFARLGAAVDLVRTGVTPDSSPLTSRELEVLRLLAAGETNRAIASSLVLSERTVDRHVSNIFTKLGVSSRTAAAAYAIERWLA